MKLLLLLFVLSLISFSISPPPPPTDDDGTLCGINGDSFQYTEEIDGLKRTLTSNG